jgi:osmoprotectant transport system permease protein
MSGFLAQNGSQIVELTLEHLWLTGNAMLLAAGIGGQSRCWV